MDDIHWRMRWARRGASGLEEVGTLVHASIARRKDWRFGLTFVSLPVVYISCMFVRILWGAVEIDERAGIVGGREG